MSGILKALSKKKILISDGAWGTLLQKKGLKPSECPELWNLDRPMDVFEIAESYIRAGSDIIETNSFGASSVKLEGYGLRDQAVEINRAASIISRKAAGKDHFVIGSIGPCGKLLLMEEIIPSDLYDSFSEQASALEDGGADAIVIETMTDLQEALLAIKAVKENTRMEIACTMTFDKIITGEFRTMMGVSPEEMTHAFLEAGADIIGTNCGHGMQDMEGIVKEIRKVNQKVPVMVQANAGIPVYKDGETFYPQSPEWMAGLIAPVLAAGADIIGGCCGTTPEHILKIADAVSVNLKKR